MSLSKQLLDDIQPLLFTEDMLIKLINNIPYENINKVETYKSLLDERISELMMEQKIAEKKNIIKILNLGTKITNITDFHISDKIWYLEEPTKKGFQNNYNQSCGYYGLLQIYKIRSRKSTTIISCKILDIYHNMCEYDTWMNLYNSRINIRLYIILEDNGDIKKINDINDPLGNRNDFCINIYKI